MTKCSILTVAAWLSLGSVWAQDQPDPGLELQRQGEQLRLLRQRNETAADARLQEPARPPGQRLTEETPCRTIDVVQIDANGLTIALDTLDGPEGDDPPLGRCLGTQGIELLIERVQNELVARGYITSRVNALSQDLLAGQLVLTVEPGRIARIRSDTFGGGAPWSGNAVAASAGDVLNLRDIEQSLENLRRSPNAEADIQVVPAEAAGHSDVVIRYQRSSPLRLSLSLDDAGSRSTGQWQGGGTVSWDSPLGLADLLYVSWGQDVGGRESGPRSSDNAVLHYSVPWGYWLFSATTSRNRYQQTVVGAFQPYLFSGESAQSEFQASRVVHRGPISKTVASIKAFSRSSRNFVDDTEVRVQRRQTGGWEAGLQHTQYFDRATLGASLSFRQGTGAFGSLPAPEEAFGEGTARMRLTQGELSFAVPFAVSGASLQYSGKLRAQWGHTPLTPQDRFCIGGRYTVRGFDGVQSLCGERGKTSRNEVSWAVPSTPLQVYGAWDFGHVAGPSAPDGALLTGVALGLRCHFQMASASTQLDLFVGKPIRKPHGFDTAGTTVGVSLSTGF